MAYIFCDLSYVLLCTGDCGHLPLRRDLYKIINETNSTVEGSLVEFQCFRDALISDDVNNTLLLTQCLSSGHWHPQPTELCAVHTEIMIINEK